MNVADKRKIYENLKNLKIYNQNRRASKQSTVYVTEHLPMQFQQERKMLLPYFKKGKRTKIFNGEQRMVTTRYMLMKLK